ncbi:MAG: HAD family hydrolase [Thermoplasmata archaeon]|nr:HAD family hydrolase [Thermoplasmata archaeon]
MGEFPWRLVTFDIDGTLTTVHGWLLIARAAGRESRYRETNTRFSSRSTGEDEHLGDLLALAEGLTLTEVEKLLAGTPKLSGIGAGVAELHRRGAKVALLTHNPSYVGEWYRGQFGFDDFEGCRTPPLQDGRIPPPGRVHADKRTGLRRLIARLGVAPVEVAHVGDGWADIPVFGWTGGSIALNSRWPEVDRAATVAMRTRSFAPILEALTTMTPHAPVNDDLASDEALNT